MDIVNGEWMRSHFENRSWEWIDENHFVCRERSLSKDGSHIISREVVVHAERGVIADQFYAERLYTFREIKMILQALNFTDIKQHGDLVAESSRNQDLGMMANRMFISATAPLKNKKPAITKKQTSILVLLGDPRLPDSVKRDGKFNNEDIETIQKLKHAMTELQYPVKYLNHHKMFIDYLRRYKPDFFVNFCDEGFKNKAIYEFHVPALLEMLDIPYSGAAPALEGHLRAFALVPLLLKSLIRLMEINYHGIIRGSFILQGFASHSPMTFLCIQFASFCFNLSAITNTR